MWKWWIDNWPSIQSGAVLLKLMTASDTVLHWCIYQCNYKVISIIISSQSAVLLLVCDHSRSPVMQHTSLHLYVVETVLLKAVTPFNVITWMLTCKTQ